MTTLTHEVRWVLGFDGGCHTCSRLAAQLVDLSNGKLTARGLRSPEVQAWREQAFGPNAPWAPTLFAINGATICGWVGPRLWVQLGRLVGIKGLWNILHALGELVDVPSEPTSPRRRRLLRQGLVGVVAASALLGNPPFASRWVALAQSKLFDYPGGIGGRWELDKLAGNQFDTMEQRAQGDNKWLIIRNYFKNDRGWNVDRREAFEITLNGALVRRVYVVTFKNPGFSEWAHVMYARESGGREWRFGHLWPNGKYVDRFYVQNGNLRREDGRVGTSSVEDQGFEPSHPNVCTLERALCGTTVILGCAVGGAYVAAFCAVSFGFSCGTGAVLVSECGIIGDESIRGCVDWASEGDCPTN